MSWSLGGTSLGDLNYAYDGGGRIVKRLGSLATTGLPQAMPAATYDLANRLTNWNGTPLSHDANGNMLGDGSNSYAWNARNQLAALSGANLGVFMYDGLGRRAAKSINGVTTQFLHDGLNPVQELSSTGTPTANLLTGLKIDEFFMRTDTAGARSYLSDILGSTVALSDSSGAIATTYSYEPFGKPTAGGASSTNPFQFTGRENDGNGLYFYRSRYYGPALQRFVSQDPIEFAGGDLNLYGYVTNDPIGSTDPLGLAAQPPNRCKPDDECKKKVWDKFVFCVVALEAIADLGISPVVIGCALSGPGVATCLTFALPAVEIPKLIGQGACYVQYLERVKDCEDNGG